MSQKPKTTTPLSETVVAIRANRAILAQQEGDVPFKSRQGWAIQRRAVSDVMPALVASVTAAVIPKKVVAVFCSSENPEALKQAVQIIAENDGVVFDAAKIWNEVLAVVEPGMGPTRTWSVTSHHLASLTIAETARELDVGSMDQPKFFEVVDTSPDGIRAAARKLAADADVPDLVTRRFKNEVVEAVISKELVAKPVPVLVVGASPEEVAALTLCVSKASTKILTAEEDGLLLAGEGAKILHEAFKSAA